MNLVWKSTTDYNFNYQTSLFYHKIRFPDILSNVDKQQQKIQVLTPADFFFWIKVKFSSIKLLLPEMFPGELADATPS